MQSQGFPGPAWPSAQPGRQRRWLWLVLVIALPLLLCVLSVCSIRVTFQTFQVGGPAMQPALSAGDEVLVNTLAYAFSGPSRGDVIVFHYPRDPKQEFIKRVLAIPGDTIKEDVDQIWVNGVLLHEPYIAQPLNPQLFIITLKANEYFVAGDNRPFSSDSRTWGPVPSNYIIGKAVYVTGPKDVGFISTYPDVFSAIK